jgi:hypothetical protein
MTDVTSRVLPWFVYAVNDVGVNAGFTDMQLYDLQCAFTTKEKAEAYIKSQGEPNKKYKVKKWEGENE